MGVRSAALEWLACVHGVTAGARYCSRLYEAEESWTGTPAWWHSIPLSRLRDRRLKYIRLVCEAREPDAFHYLRVPIRMLERSRAGLDAGGHAIILHLSASERDLFTDLRGPGRVDFAEFLVEESEREATASGRSPRDPALRRYGVYVIELSPDAAPRRQQELPPLYVGQSAHTPEYRFAQHKAGGLTSAPKVRRFGLRLRPDLYDRLPTFHTRQEAEIAEAALAEELERSGHRVFWG